MYIIPIILRIKEYIKKCSTTQTIHITFYEQAICGRKYKHEKNLLMKESKIDTALLFDGWVWDSSLLFKEQRQKMLRMGFLGLSCDTP